MDILSCVDVGNSKIYHRGVYKVVMKTVHIESRKDLTFSLELYTESSKMKIIISDERDPCFLCVVALTRKDYDELKKQQGLLIDFDSFPSQFVRLLQHSIDGNMFLTLQQDAEMNMVFDIVEHNDFKRLVHLSLRTGPASDADIKKNMAQNVLSLKKKITELTKKVTEEECMFREKEQMLDTKVKDLNMALCRIQDDKMQRECEHQEIIKRERDKLDEERREWKKCAELHSQTQVGSIQEALNRKEKQLEDSVLHNRQLQDTVKSLELQIMDQGLRIGSLEKQLHVTRGDADSLRTQNNALDREYHDKEMNLQHTRTKLIDIEKTLNDKSDMLREALDSLQSVKREKISLEEQVVTLEVLSSKHKTETKNTSEQLMKANQIIARLNNDLVEMREKLMCRTAIALEQEKVIERHSLEVESLVNREKNYLEENKHLRAELELMKLDTEKFKRVILDKEETIKNNNTVIQWMHKKLDGFNSHDTLSTINSRGLHSGPFLSSNNTTDKNPMENNNDIINAYSAGLNLKPLPDRTSRYLTRSDESITEIDNDDKQKCGLDTVYLRPNSSVRSKSQESSKTCLTKEDLATSRSNKILGKTLSTNRSSKSLGPQSRKTSTRRSDAPSNPISPFSAYFAKP